MGQIAWPVYSLGVVFTPRSTYFHTVFKYVAQIVRHFLTTTTSPIPTAPLWLRPWVLGLRHSFGLHRYQPHQFWKKIFVSSVLKQFFALLAKGPKLCVKLVMVYAYQNLYAVQSYSNPLIPHLSMKNQGSSSLKYQELSNLLGLPSVCFFVCSFVCFFLVAQEHQLSNLLSLASVFCLFLWLPKCSNCPIFWAWLVFLLILYDSQETLTYRRKPPSLKLQIKCIQPQYKKLDPKQRRYSMKGFDLPREHSDEVLPYDYQPIYLKGLLQDNFLSLKPSWSLSKLL